MTKPHPDLDPGIESRRDNDIHPLAIRYIELDDRFKDAQESRNEAKEHLVACMNRKGRGTYVADGVDVKVSSSITVKVKRTDADED